MDALSREIAGLSDKLGEVIRRADRLEAESDRREAAAMEQRLAAGSLTGSRSVGLATPDAIAEGAPILARLRDDVNVGSYTGGRIDPFFGRANMLKDPTMEQMSTSVALTGAGPDVVGSQWEAESLFTGGGGGSATVEGANESRFLGELGRSSGRARIWFDWNAIGTPVEGTVSLRALSLYSTNDDVPWLVASCRVVWDATALVTDGITGTVRIALLDSSDVEVATSDPVAVEDGDDVHEVLISTALEAPSDTYRPAIIFELEAAAIVGGTSRFFDVFELQLVESDTEDPPSFTPAIGSWAPNVMRSFIESGSSEALIESYDPGADLSIGNGLLFSVMPDGAMTWYDDAGDPLMSLDPRGAQGGEALFSRTLAEAIDSNDGSSPTTWLEFPVQDGRAYGITIFGTYNVSHTSQGLHVGFIHPGGLGQMLCQVFGNGSAIVSHGDFLSEGTPNTTVLSTGATTDATTGRAFRLDGVYTCTADGTFRLRFRRGGANTTAPGVTIRAGSTVIVSAAVA